MSICQADYLFASCVLAPWQQYMTQAAAATEDAGWSNMLLDITW
jgi:hypothetical protein